MAKTPYGTTNELVMLGTSSSPLGRSNSSPDASTVDTTTNNFSSIIRRQSYERLDDSLLNRSNPPFNTGSAGRLMDGMPQISRGYIRRNIYDPNDPTSNYRLYFMYNPADIQRNYVAYIEQQALDPFNTIYGSNNLIAPPGILDFSFDLFFDRQTENATGTIPRGVMTDQEYFDLVVRGLVPDGQSPALQDSGIMMINPRNITVVFGPQLSVQGRPYRASIQYQKFDHRMTPTRMTITLSMKAVYFGPQRSDFAFASSQTENTFAATIPYDESIKYNIDYDTVASVTSTEGTGSTSGGNSSPDSNITSPVTNGNITGTLFNTAGVQLDAYQMTDLVIASGLRGEPAAIAISIAYKESRFNSGAHNPVFPDDSWGLFQFNFRPGANTVESLGATPEQCTIPAIAMIKFIEKSSNATQFRPWAVMPNGNYGRFQNNVLVDTGNPMEFLPYARNALRAKGAY